MSTDAIARLKITLDDVKPVVLRRVEVPLAIRLDRLHHVLQIAVGWTDSHLYEFRIRGIGFGVPDPDWSMGNDPIDTRKTTLLAAIEDTGAKSFKYLYDFGDGWEHTVKIEKIQPATPIRVSWRPAADARRKTSAVPGATRRSSRLSQIPNTNATMKCATGSASNSIQPCRSTPPRSTRTCSRSPSYG